MTNGVLSNLAAGAKGTVNFSFQMPLNDALKDVRDPRVRCARVRLDELRLTDSAQRLGSAVAVLLLTLDERRVGHVVAGARQVQLDAAGRGFVVFHQQDVHWAQAPRSVMS